MREGERERERERKSERDRAGKWQREESEYLKQSPGSELSVQSLMWGSNPNTMRS